METVTTRVKSDTYAEIEDRTDGETSKSAVTRELIERGLEAEEIEAERDRLDRHLKQLLQEREEHGQLVEYVQEEKSLRQRQRERQRMKEEANILHRFKWSLTGMPTQRDGEE